MEIINLETIMARVTMPIMAAAVVVVAVAVAEAMIVIMVEDTM